MIDVLWVKAVLKTLVLPPTSLLLLAAIGLGLRRRHPRGGNALAATAIGLLLLLSVPVVANFLTGFVDVAPPLDVRTVQDARAVVILGGGIRRDAPEYDGDTLASLTLERVRYGARVARLTGLPVLVSGGSVLGGEPEAAVMRKALEVEFNVPVRWVEPHSRTTHENAVFSARILRREGIRRVVLVAHGFDMRRAIAEFAAEGIDVVPAPTGTRAGRRITPLDFLPSIAGLQASYFASYEILANVVRVVSARF